MAKVSIQFQTTGAQKALQEFEALSKAEQKAVLQTLELDKASNKADRSMNKAAKSGQVEFGKLAQNITGISSAMDIALKGVEKLTEGYRKLREEREKAGEGLVSQVGAEAKFKSISGGSAARENDLIQRSRRVQRETGLEAGPASDLVFRLASAGQDADLADFIQLQNVERDGAQVAAIQDAAAVIRTNLGRAEVGSAREQINKIRQAGALNESGGAAEIAAQSTQSAAAAGALGTSDEELLAIIAKVFPGLKDTSGAAIGSLAASLEKQGFNTGGGILSSVDAFVAAGGQGKDLEQRAQRVFTIIQQNRATIEAFEAAIDAAGRSTGTAGDQLAIDAASQSREQAAVLAAARARQAAELATTEAFGTEEQARQAATDRLRQEDIEAGLNFSSRLRNRAVRFGLSQVTDDEAILREAGTTSNAGLAADMAGGIGILIDIGQGIIAAVRENNRPVSGESP